MASEADALARDEAQSSPLPPLFDQTNVRKPEYWQFAKLIAPSAELPEGCKQWTAQDAVGIWCLRCAKALVFQKGSSQSIRYHMETKHRADLDAFLATVPSPSAAKKPRVGSVDGTVDATPLGHSDQPVTTTAKPSSTSSSPPSWATNLTRRGGFWGDAHWYDLHLERRLPLAKPLVDELVAALPPCSDSLVLELCAGSGRATEALLAAYPLAHVTLVDSSEERLRMAQQRLTARGHTLSDQQLVRAFVTPATVATVSPVAVDVVVACLALHVVVAQPPHYAENAASGEPQPQPVAPVAAYELVFRGIWDLLQPGGHVVFGDHVGQLGLFAQLQLLARVGFVDVDCAWRQQDFFVAGARKPVVE